jgi:hypothetical protein
MRDSNEPIWGWTTGLIAILYICLSFWSCASSGPIAGNAVDNPSSCPRWINHPPGNQNGLHYIVGLSDLFKIEKAARIDAANYCISQLAGYCGVQVRLVHRYYKEYHGKSGGLIEPHGDIHVYEEYISKLFVSGLQTKEWCVQQVLANDKSGRPYHAWKAYLLAAVPEEEIERIKSYKPPVVLAPPKLFYRFNGDQPVLFWNEQPPEIDSIAVFQAADVGKWTEIQRMGSYGQREYRIHAPKAEARYKIIAGDGLGNQVESNEVRVAPPARRKGVFYLISTPSQVPSQCFHKVAAFFEDSLSARLDQLKIPWQKQNASKAETVYHFYVYPEACDDRYRINIENVQTGKILYRGRYRYGENGESGACQFGIGSVDKVGIRAMIPQIVSE